MDPVLNLAVIGMGSRSASLMTVFNRIYPGLRVRCVADPDVEGARRRLRAVAPAQEGVRFFAGADELLERAEDFDGILIGTRCNLHAPLAIKVSATCLPVFLEKPVAKSHQQIVGLRDAYRGREKQVVVSFPLRSTPLFAAVMEVVDSERLGTINQVQAINNVPYGGGYYSEGYRDYEVTGGLWLQKATHDFDYLNQVLGRPVAITSMMTRKIYGGVMPHGLWCSACEKDETCLESPRGVARRGDDGGVGTRDHPCVYGDEIKNQDAGSAIIMYEDGAHAVYSQNFVSRRSAGRRGAIITGYRASLSFDWYTGTLTVIDHHRDRVETVKIRAATGHLGGDEALARNFGDVCLGRDEARTDLSAGLISAAMCLAARESAHKQKWMPVGDVYAEGYPDVTSFIRRTPADLEPVV